MKICEECGLKGMRNFINSKTFGKLLCKDCYNKYASKDKRERQEEKHLCWNCGEKIIPELCPHCKKPVSYTKRCKACLEKTYTKKKK